MSDDDRRSDASYDLAPPGPDTDQWDNEGGAILGGALPVGPDRPARDTGYLIEVLGEATLAIVTGQIYAAMVATPSQSKDMDKAIRLARELIRKVSK